MNSRSLPAALWSSPREQGLTVSGDGRWIATRGDDGTARLVDVSSPSQRHRPRQLARGVGWVSKTLFSGDGRWLAVTSESGGTRRGSIDLIDLRQLRRTPRRLAAPSDDAVENVAFSPDGRWLVAAFGSAIYDRSNRVVVLWHLTSPQRRHWILRGHTRFVEELAFSFDGRWLVTQSGDSFSGAFTTRLWDLTAADPSSSVRALAGGDAGRGSGGLVIDSRWVAAAGTDGAVRLWDLRADDPAAEVRVVRSHEGEVTTLAISPDGHWLVTGGSDGTTAVWDLDAPDPARRSWTLRADDTAPRVARFSPDGRWLLTIGSAPFLWKVDDLRDGGAAIPLRGHDEAVDGFARRIVFAFSTDRHWLATAGDEGRVVLWDLSVSDPAARRAVVVARYVYELAFSTDGTSLITRDGDGVVSLTELRAEALVRAACRAVGRNFTLAEWQQYFPDASPRKTCPNLPTSPVVEELATRAGELLDARHTRRAVAALTDAVREGPRSPRTPEAEACRIVAARLVEDAADHARAGNPGEATLAWLRARRLDPAAEASARARYAATRSLAVALARDVPQRRIDRDVAIPSLKFRAICWFGSLLGHAPAVLESCDRAITTSDPERIERTAAYDSRALARALSGDAAGAISDYRYFLAHSISNQSSDARARRGSRPSEKGETRSTTASSVACSTSIETAIERREPRRDDSVPRRPTHDRLAGGAR